MTPTPLPTGPWPWLDLIIKALLQANVGIPILFTTIIGIVNIFKGAFGSGPTVPEISTALKAQLAANDAAGRAEVERLEAMLAA